MNLSAVISDLHFGMRGNNQQILNNICEFLDKLFFPTLIERNIRHIIFCGDLFDARRNINFNTFDKFNKHFLRTILDNNIKLDIIIGNHDTIYSDSISENSPYILGLGKYKDNVTIYYKPTELQINGINVAYLPWIAKGYEEQSLNFVIKTNAEFLFSHLELKDYKASSAAHKIILKDVENDVCVKHLGKFKLVMTGHDHRKQMIGENVLSLGSPLQFNYGDANLPKGFYLFDPVEEYIEFIENPNELFVKIYDLELPKFDMKNKFIKIMKTSQMDKIELDKFIKDLEKQKPYKIDVDDVVITKENKVIKCEDTTEIIRISVGELQIDKGMRMNLSGYLIDLYNKCDIARKL
jgi:DNA repair exonuclease SbcCD nuclease subunit